MNKKEAKIPPYFTGIERSEYYETVQNNCHWEYQKKEDEYKHVRYDRHYNKKGGCKWSIIVIFDHRCSTVHVELKMKLQR